MSVQTLLCLRMAVKMRRVTQVKEAKEAKKETPAPAPAPALFALLL